MQKAVKKEERHEEREENQQLGHLIEWIAICERLEHSL